MFKQQLLRDNEEYRPQLETLFSRIDGELFAASLRHEAPPKEKCFLIRKETSDEYFVLERVLEAKPMFRNNMEKGDTQIFNRSHHFNSMA
jgi:hypothetical protein